jgi:hypothetical protein
MAPSAVEVYPTTAPSLYDLKVKAQEIVSQKAVSPKLIKAPMKLSGALDKYDLKDLTPCIGREFPTAKLVDWLKAPNADELIRDLAITGKQAQSSIFHSSLKTEANPYLKSLSVASSSSVLKMTSPTTCRRSFAKNWVN